ncbi:hypothetical protein TNCV_2321701 [Trichonephila clavipes]|nr:hypothetical protein TNCV_2321701 [Trichonephila clavipes]
MTSHNRLDDSLRWRTVGKLEAGQSQAKVVRWLQVARKRFFGYGINSKQVALLPGSDQSKCTRQSDSRRVLTWRENEASFHPSYTTKFNRFGAKRILVCGGILLSSRTPLYVFDMCTVNSQHFKDQILEAYVRSHNRAIGNGSFCCEPLRIDEDDTRLAPFPTALTCGLNSLIDLTRIGTSTNLIFDTNTLLRNSPQTINQVLNTSDPLHPVMRLGSDKLDGPDRYTRDFKYPHNQKSTGVKSGDRGGHGYLQRLLTILSSPNICIRNALIGLAV